MDTEETLKLMADCESRLAVKDAHILALENEIGRLSFEVKCLKGMLRDRVPDDVEAE